MATAIKVMMKSARERINGKGPGDSNTYTGADAGTDTGDKGNGREPVRDGNGNDKGGVQLKRGGKNNNNSKDNGDDTQHSNYQRSQVQTPKSSNSQDQGNDNRLQSNSTITTIPETTNDGKEQNNNENSKMETSLSTSHATIPTLDAQHSSATSSIPALTYFETKTKAAASVSVSDDNIPPWSPSQSYFPLPKKKIDKNIQSTAQRITADKSYQTQQIENHIVNSLSSSSSSVSKIVPDHKVSSLNRHSSIQTNPLDSFAQNWSRIKSKLEEEAKQMDKNQKSDNSTNSLNGTKKKQTSNEAEATMITCKNIMQTSSTTSSSTTLASTAKKYALDTATTVTNNTLSISSWNEKLIEDQIKEEFSLSITKGNIPIQKDTSVTGKYGKQNYKPYGFIPSTDKGCQQEIYEVIKPSPFCQDYLKKQSNSLSSPSQHHENQSSNHYESWDPRTMQYIPKQGNLLPQMSENPRFNAAAGTRAALLSFMTKKESLRTSSNRSSLVGSNDSSSNNNNNIIDSRNNLNHMNANNDTNRTLNTSLHPYHNAQQYESILSRRHSLGMPPSFDYSSSGYQNHHQNHHDDNEGNYHTSNTHATYTASSANVMNFHHDNHDRNEQHQRKKQQLLHGQFQYQHETHGKQKDKYAIFDDYEGATDLYRMSHSTSNNHYHENDVHLNSTRNGSCRIKRNNNYDPISFSRSSSVTNNRDQYEAPYTNTSRTNNHNDFEKVSTEPKRQKKKKGNKSLPKKKSAKKININNNNGDNFTATGSRKSSNVDSHDVKRKRSRAGSNENEDTSSLGNNHNYIASSHNKGLRRSSRKKHKTKFDDDSIGDHSR